MVESVASRRRAVIVAGHRGDHHIVLAGLGHAAPAVRAAAVGAAARCGVLTPERLSVALADHSRSVRLRAIDAVAQLPGDGPPALTPLLTDTDDRVVERAAWASGERAPAEPGVVACLSTLVTSHSDKLVREAAVAALGAIGDPDGLTAIVDATADIATVRRRAVLALAPFEGELVDRTLHDALTDRDWQTRQAAADVLGVDDVEL